MLLSELYTPKQVLHYICPIALSLATDRVADVRIIAFKLVSTNNHSFIRATINSRSSGNVCNTRTVVVTSLISSGSIAQRGKKYYVYIFLLFFEGKLMALRQKFKQSDEYYFFPFLLIMGFRLPCCRLVCYYNDSMSVLRRDLYTNMSVI